MPRIPSHPHTEVVSNPIPKRLRQSLFLGALNRCRFSSKCAWYRNVDAVLIHTKHLKNSQILDVLLERMRALPLFTSDIQQTFDSLTKIIPYHRRPKSIRLIHISRVQFLFAWMTQSSTSTTSAPSRALGLLGLMPLSSPVTRIEPSSRLTA